MFNPILFNVATSSPEAFADMLLSTDMATLDDNTLTVVWRVIATIWNGFLGNPEIMEPAVTHVETAMVTRKLPLQFS